MQRADSLEKILMMGKTEGKRRECQRVRWLDNITISVDMDLSKLLEIVKNIKHETKHFLHQTEEPDVLQTMGLQSQKRLSNWTAL